jgi:hypothetical protein
MMPARTSWADLITEHVKVKGLVIVVETDGLNVAKLHFLKAHCVKQ